MLRRILVCAAFATWCFLNFWMALADRRVVYFLRQDPGRTALAAVLAWEALIALAMFGAWEFLRRRPRDRGWADGLFLALCVFPSGIAAAALIRLSPWLTGIVAMRWFWPAAVLAVVLAVAGAARRRAFSIHRTAGRMRAVLLWSWPALAVVMFQSAATLVRYSSSDYADSPLAARLPARPGVRVVWIIFDEASEALMFEHRPAGMSFPNFDRLKSESFQATAAFAPANNTLLSMPSLITGEHVVAARPDGPGDLRIQIRSRPGWLRWTALPNVFDAAREAGFNTAIAGWYHPYGRLLTRSLTECFWTPTGIEPGVEDALNFPFPDRAWVQATTLPLAGHIPLLSPLRYHRRVRARDFQNLMDHAAELAADPAIGLALLHLPVPHQPGIYDRAKGEIDADASSGYIDNLALADRSFGELRQKMEDAGLWERTAVIVSADHGWRVSMWRSLPGWTAQDEALASMDASAVPVLVKLPGESGGFVYNPTFDTIVTREIIVGILERRIRSARDIEEAIVHAQAPLRAVRWEANQGRCATPVLEEDSVVRKPSICVSLRSRS